MLLCHSAHQSKVNSREPAEHGLREPRSCLRRMESSHCGGHSSWASSSFAPLPSGLTAILTCPHSCVHGWGHVTSYSQRVVGESDGVEHLIAGASAFRLLFTLFTGPSNLRVVAAP